jgi:hypothetical protein
MWPSGEFEICGPAQTMMSKSCVVYIVFRPIMCLDGLPWVKIGSHLHCVSSNDKGRDVERLIAECVSQVLA